MLVWSVVIDTLFVVALMSVEGWSGLLLLINCFCCPHRVFGVCVKGRSGL